MKYARLAAAWCLRTLGWWLVEWGYRLDGTPEDE